MALSDAALFMDMDLFPLKEEDTLETAASAAMDFPASSLELVQLLAYDEDVFMDDHVFALSDRSAGGNEAAAYSPTATDDFSDAVTDDASEVSSPPPAFAEDDSLAVHGFVSSPPNGGGAQLSVQRPINIVKQAPPSPEPALAPTTAASTNVPTAAMLPFAFPVACFPSLNGNLKRPLPDVLPSQPAASTDPLLAKKSKRELRQMKNRESANRSRLRRKAQLTDLSGEVDELLKKQHELQNTIARLQAENTSLHDQNTFLRSLVTMYSDPSRTMALPPVPSSSNHPAATLRPPIPLGDLESGGLESRAESLLEEEDDEEEEEQSIMLPSQKKQRKLLGRSAAAVSAASLGLCASVFGLTVLTDSDNTAAQSSHIRRPGRVLHSLPSTAEQGCSPSPLESLMERMWEVIMSSWSFLTTSELAYGVFLNVLSFVVIMGLYHCYQQHSASARISKRSLRWDNLNSSAQREASRRAAAAKRRSVSWQDVRVAAAAPNETGSTLPRVQIFT